MSDIGPLYVGRSLLRREDRRLLRGQGQFIADLLLPRMLHAVLVRSPVAHARIRSVDLSRAAAAPGAALALNGADLLQLLQLLQLLPPVPEWRTLNLDTKTRGRKTDEGLEIIGRLWREETVDFEGVHYHLSGASISPKPVQPDLPMWIGGSSEAAIRRTARFGTGWQAGGETPEDIGAVVAAIRAAAIAEGRPIDDDHYGAGIAFRFGRRDDPALERLFDAYRKRTGRDPQKHFAIGDAEAIVERVAAYVEGGISKFILRPAARGDEEMLSQTHRLIEEVLPLVAARWPKPAKRRAAAE
jgi:hypothetical protein